VLLLSPDVAAMAAAPVQFHVHAIVGMLLFALWPFTRLVHAFTAPLHYLFRPYIVYRSRDGRTSGNRSSRPGWSGVGTSDRDRRH
jgi:nitrate reductase gamma subunit